MGESEPFHEQTKKSIEKAIMINTLYFFEGTYYPLHEDEHGLAVTAVRMGMAPPPPCALQMPFQGANLIKPEMKASGARVAHS